MNSIHTSSPLSSIISEKQGSVVLAEAERRLATKQPAPSHRRRPTASGVAGSVCARWSRLLPGRNLCYTRLAWERFLSDEIQAWVDAGDAAARFRRVERNARKEFDQRFWWRPGALTPRRAPPDRDWQAEQATHQHQLRRAAQSNHAHEHEKVHEADQCVFKEGGKLGTRHCLALHALQLRAHPSSPSGDTRDGGWRDGPAMGD